MTVYISGYIRIAFKLMDLYSGTIFFKLLYKSKSYANFKQKSPRDDGLLAEPTTEVNGNDP